MVHFKNSLINVLVTFVVCSTIKNCALAVKNANQNQNIPQRYFIPVTQEWQNDMCAKLGVEIYAENDFESTHNKLNKPLDSGLKDVKGDGNCYFRAISVWITGSEYAHAVLRRKLVEFMKESPIMIQYFNGEEKLNEYIETKEIENEGIWATDIEIRATAIMLDTTILIYADQQTNNWEVHHKSGDLRSDMEKNEKCIYLKSINSTHYQVVTAVEEYQDESNLDNCKEALDSVFGLSTRAHDCVKITIKNIMFSSANLDDAVIMYIFTFKSSSINCDNILLPNDYCKREAYGQEGYYNNFDDSDSALQEIYEACLIEVSVFGDDQNKIFENAISFHKSGEESLAWPGRNSSQNKYFIHQFGSFGDAYLDHIGEVIKLNGNVLDPIPFCKKAKYGKTKN